jgi:hypothetical protein
MVAVVVGNDGVAVMVEVRIDFGMDRLFLPAASAKDVVTMKKKKRTDERLVDRCKAWIVDFVEMYNAGMGRMYLCFSGKAIGLNPIQSCCFLSSIDTYQQSNATFEPSNNLNVMIFVGFDVSEI